jgi:hypothetical protein
MSPSGSHPGFDRLVATARRLELPIVLQPPMEPLPDTTELGVPLDSGLKVLFGVINGGHIWQLSFLPYAPPPGRLLSINRSIRDARGNGRLSRTLAFAQLGHQPTFLSTFALAHSGGQPQPVTYIDLAEDPLLVPIASSVDGCLELVATYLQALEERSGSVESGLMEWIFPWTVPDLVSRDGRLVKLIQQGEFESNDFADPEVRDYLMKVVSKNSKRPAPAPRIP